MYHDEEIRLIAYRIWEGEGRPEGRDLEHWFKAEAIWQERQGQIEHLAEDVFSRVDLAAPKVISGRRQKGGKYA
jgi:hypothetical protein